MTKRILSVTVCLLLVFATTAAMLMPAAALTYIKSADAGLSKSGTTAHLSCSVTGYQGLTTSCKITANLQQYKNGAWTTIDTWTQSYNSYRGTLSASRTVAAGFSYRVLASVTGNTETISITSKTVSF